MRRDESEVVRASDELNMFLMYVTHAASLALMFHNPWKHGG